MSAKKFESKTRDELYEIAKTKDIEGRSTMTKDEIIKPLTNSQKRVGPKGLDEGLIPAITRRGEFDDVLEVEEGNTVEVSHLSRETPEVTQVVREKDKLEVTMETTRGGRHRLIVPLDDYGEPRAKGAHLRRWRAGDAHWMMNSSTPYFLKIIE